MEELNFKTQVFEGPLDLLLVLIAKHKLNIRDIEISVLLEQFLLYLEKMQEADIDIAAEFLEMAARLIYIKTSALLPKHEVEELKKELQGALIEYALCKAAAERLKRHYIGSDVFVREPAPIDVDNAYHGQHETDELFGVYMSLSEKARRLEKETVESKPLIAHSFVSVFTKIVYVLRRIQYGGRMRVDSLYKGQSRSEQVAIFLALLELSKYSRVSFSDDSDYLEFVGKDVNGDVSNNTDDYEEKDNQ